jgi:predicted nuclease of predicted toxin-antitoxin system
VRIKIDENLPAELVELLAARGIDADSSTEEGLAGRPDDDIWRAAQNADRLLITQDLDFSDVRRFQPGTHAGLVLDRLHEPSRKRLIERTCQLFDSVEANTWQGCFVVVTDHKYRVRRPPDP